MYVIQLTTDSEMRRKSWQTIRQCVAGTLSKSNCNYITPSILYVILTVTKVMHQQLLICDILRSGNINNHLRRSRLSETSGASIVCQNSSTKSLYNNLYVLTRKCWKKSEKLIS